MGRLSRVGIAALIGVLGILASASSASATILEVGGASKNEKVEITASLDSGTSLVLARTDGSLANTCTASHVNGSTESPFTETKVTGALSSLSFSSCERTVTVHKPGKLYVEHIAGTTNGTVSSEEAEVTVGSIWGTLNCKTNTGTDIGTLTGKKEANATLDINAVLNCGFLLPSATWKGNYTVTSPSGLGVTAEEVPKQTSLEVGGTPKGEPVEITGSLAAGTSLVLSKTDGSFGNACDTAHVKGTTSVFSGPKVTGALSTLTFESCTRPVTVHKAGKLYVEHIAGTTNGTVSSEEAEVTVGTPFGTLNCITSTGTDIGTLTGVKEGNATLHINAVLNCGFLLPSATWKGSYTITSPSGLGVTDKIPPSTILEVGGTPKSEAVEVTGSLETGTLITLSKTDGSIGNACDTSHLKGTTSVFTGSKVTGALSTFTFESCTRPVTVHKAGKLYVEHIAGTTNGTLSSEEAEFTVGTPFGTVNCNTGAGTDIGTLTGKKEGNATIDINAVLNCGVLLPSANWKGSYTITSPSGLGVTE